MKKMTEAELEKAGQVALNLEETCLSHLYFRWQEERLFEDFADYQKIVKRHVEELGLTYVRMTKRPFGVVVRMTDDITFRVTVNSDSYSWKRLRE